ncbi:unnamed protein product [Soboliphyme baturini]|uniref:Rib_recp_KP_reg domain-containing protein n=1 Tax=Soboliphyme baturini TaxID=241478 RepID=A0A183IF05_9BILA|nr:unnamed protein product [Soboliphyme baturini]
MWLFIIILLIIILLWFYHNQQLSEGKPGIPAIQMLLDAIGETSIQQRPKHGEKAVREAQKMEEPEKLVTNKIPSRDQLKAKLEPRKEKKQKVRQVFKRATSPVKALKKERKEVEAKVSTSGRIKSEIETSDVTASQRNKLKTKEVSVQKKAEPKMRSEVGMKRRLVKKLKRKEKKEMPEHLIQRPSEKVDKKKVLEEKQAEVSLSTARASAPAETASQRLPDRKKKLLKIKSLKKSLKAQLSKKTASDRLSKSEKSSQPSLLAEKAPSALAKLEKIKKEKHEEKKKHEERTKSEKEQKSAAALAAAKAPSQTSLVGKESAEHKKKLVKIKSFKKHISKKHIPDHVAKSETKPGTNGQHLLSAKPTPSMPEKLEKIKKEKHVEKDQLQREMAARDSKSATASATAEASYRKALAEKSETREHKKLMKMKSFKKSFKKQLDKRTGSYDVAKAEKRSQQSSLAKMTPSTPAKFGKIIKDKTKHNGDVELSSKKNHKNHTAPAKREEKETPNVLEGSKQQERQELQRQSMFKGQNGGLPKTEVHDNAAAKTESEENVQDVGKVVTSRKENGRSSVGPPRKEHVKMIPVRRLIESIAKRQPKSNSSQAEGKDDKLANQNEDLGNVKDELQKILKGEERRRN